MKFYKLAFLTSAVLFCSSLSAAAVANDYSFEQERMVIDRNDIFVVSSFDSKDYITVYDFFGRQLWNISFHAKILSWKVDNDLLVVFSKDRAGTSTYLTCIDRYTGKLLWQRP